MSTEAYAHTAKDALGNPNPDRSTWEPLWTPFGEVDPNDPTVACSGRLAEHCPHHPRHRRAARQGTTLDGPTPVLI